MEEVKHGSIIVTGASGSMGKAAVKALAAEGRSVVMACRNPKAGCAGSILDLFHEPKFNHQVEVTEGVLETECSEMLSGFFRALRLRLKTETEE